MAEDEAIPFGRRLQPLDCRDPRDNRRFIRTPYFSPDGKYCVAFTQANGLIFDMDSKTIIASFDPGVEIADGLGLFESTMAADNSTLVILQKRTLTTPRQGFIFDTSKLPVISRVRGFTISLGGHIMRTITMMTPFQGAPLSLLMCLENQQTQTTLVYFSLEDPAARAQIFFEGTDLRLGSVRCSDNGEFVAATCRAVQNKVLQAGAFGFVFDRKTGKQHMRLPQATIYADVAFSRDNRVLATAENNTSITLRKLLDGQVIKVLKDTNAWPHPDVAFRNLQFSPSDRSIATIADRNTTTMTNQIVLWNIERSDHQEVSELYALFLSFTRSGDALMFWDMQGSHIKYISTGENAEDDAEHESNRVADLFHGIHHGMKGAGYTSTKFVATPRTACKYKKYQQQQ